MTDTQALAGQLQAKLEIPSWRLTKNLPIEIRDSQLHLVSKIRHNETATLKPGWYEVSAVLDDGRRHAKTVRVKAGLENDVTLEVDLSTLMPVSTSRTRGETQAADIELVSAVGAELQSQSPKHWVFVPTHDSLTTVPLARLSVDGKLLDVSLPINAGGYGENEPCVVTFEQYRQGVQVRAGFHPDRIVSAAIHNMIEKREFAQATEAAEATAADMLRGKYNDPVGAALGAIIMYRAGTLATRRKWVSNLQRDFDWLPDGKILLAALTGNSNVEVTADLLIRASEQRPLFTESFSILQDALRRWRSDHRIDEISKAFKTVAERARHVDWTAFTLTDYPQ